MGWYYNNCMALDMLCVVWVIQLGFGKLLVGCKHVYDNLHITVKHRNVIS